jgi:hypothetical protein
MNYNENHTEGGVMAVKVTGRELQVAIQGLMKIHGEFEFAYNAIYLKRRADEKLWPYNYEDNLVKARELIESACRKMPDVTLRLVDIEQEVEDSLSFEDACRHNRANHPDKNH